MDFKTAYSCSPDPGIEFKSPSLTQQHFRDECDINNIIERYEETGFLVDPLNPGTRQPVFGDFSVEFDYMAAQNIVADAQQRFEALPSALRKRFNNDPHELLLFLEDPKNMEEAVKLGLVNRPVDPISNSSVPAPGSVPSGEGSKVSVEGLATTPPPVEAPK